MEEVLYDRQLLREAERMATEYGRSAEEVLKEHKEIIDRIEKWGWDVEGRRLARESDLSEEEMRRQLDAQRAKTQARD